MRKEYYSVGIPSGYPENTKRRDVFWKEGFFMPFDVYKGVHPNNLDYTQYKKTHWWVSPAVDNRFMEFHEISKFIKLPDSKEFSTLREALSFCFKWRKDFLKDQLKMK